MVSGDGGRIGQVLHIGVLDQLLGANGGAKAAVVTQRIVDPGQILFHSDSTLGADLLTQTAADTTGGAASGGDSTLCHGSAGDQYILAGFHGNDQITGASGSAGHTADAQTLVHVCNVLDDLDSAILTSLDAAAKAQAAVLTAQRAAAANLGSSHAVLKAFVLCLQLGAGHHVALVVVETVTGAANQRYLTGNSTGLNTHDFSHSLGAFIAAGGTLADGSFAVEHSFGITAAAGITTAAAVGAGQALVQLFKTGIGLHIENLGCGSQNQAENQTQAAENADSDNNFDNIDTLLRRSSNRRNR